MSNNSINHPEYEQFIDLIKSHDIENFKIILDTIDIDESQFLYPIVYHNRPKFMEYLLNKNIKMDLIVTLYDAVTMERKRITKLLLSKQDINCVDNTGSTILHIAVSMQSEIMLTLILNNGGIKIIDIQ